MLPCPAGARSAPRQTALAGLGWLSPVGSHLSSVRSSGMRALLLASQVGVGAVGRCPGHCPFPQELEARVPEGQHLFEELLRLGPARGTSEELEDLRYRWMLYKSKLKDSGRLLVGAGRWGCG